MLSTQEKKTLYMKSADKRYQKVCSICDKTFYKVRASSLAYWKRQRFCDAICFGKWWSLSGKGSDENHHAWKGDKCGNYALHQWIYRKYGRPDHCDICGRTRQSRKYKTKNYFEWSCRTGIYTREARNWWQLCIACHRRYDKIIHGTNTGIRKIPGAREQVKCPQCKKVTTQLVCNHRKYCSMACKIIGQTGKSRVLPKECGWCRKTWKPDMNKRIFCSRHCAGKAKWANRK